MLPRFINRIWCIWLLISKYSCPWWWVLENYKPVSEKLNQKRWSTDHLPQNLDFHHLLYFFLIRHWTKDRKYPLWEIENRYFDQMVERPPLSTLMKQQAYRVVSEKPSEKRWSSDHLGRPGRFSIFEIIIMRKATISPYLTNGKYQKAFIQNRDFRLDGR